MANIDISSDKGMAELNKFLLHNSFISGYKPSLADVEVAARLPGGWDRKANPSIARWFSFVASFPPQIQAKWAGEKKEAKESKEAKAPSKEDKKDATPADRKEAPGGPDTKTGAEPEEPPADDDPFADNAAAAESDDEEDRKRQERIDAIAAKKAEENAKKGKTKVIARSCLILDVKPIGDEIDMAVLEKKVREIAMKGLTWQGSELVPIAYGIKKLRIISQIVDDLIMTDDVREEIEKMEEVQSTDIFAFNKV